MSEARTVVVDDRVVELEGPDEAPALPWLRRSLGLVGVHSGCDEGECGACTVLLGEPRDGRVIYRAVASCLLPRGDLVGRHVVTIAGLNPPEGLSPIQRALVDEGMPQCGFCLSGIVVSITGFFLDAEELDLDRALLAVDGNICRCSGYASLRRSLRRLCDEYAPRVRHDRPRVEQLVEWGVIPTATAAAGALVVESEPVPRPTDGSRTLVAGGTDLLVQARAGVDPGPVALLPREAVSRRIEVVGEHLHVGGGVTLTELAESEAARETLPCLEEMARRFGSSIIRNRATVGGNLVNASPAADLTVVLLAADAEVDLRGPDGRRRRIPLARFYLDYRRVDRREGELLDAVRIPRGHAIAFEKVSQRHVLDIASVNAAARLRMEDGRIADVAVALGGVAPVPLLASRAAGCLRGRPLDPTSLHEAMAALDEEITPIDDVRGSARYKRALAHRLLVALLGRLESTAPGLEVLP